MPFDEYTRQFTPSTPLVKPKLIEAGSQEERFARRPLHEHLVKAVVNRIEIFAELHLRLNGKVTEQHRFHAGIKTPILPAVGIALVGVHGGILAVIATNDG